jgi:hypothetical protein
MDKQQMRQSEFKKVITSDDSRRRREDTTVQIRKAKKEERLNVDDARQRDVTQLSLSS